MTRRTRAGLSVLAVLVAAIAGAAYLLHQDRTLVWLKSHCVNFVDRRSALDESAVKDLFDLGRVGDRFGYDPVAHLVSLPDQLQEWPWPEHPSGKIVLRTNNLGLREDEPTLPEKHGLRILVAGDSHTAGSIDNAQSFANLLEARLRGGGANSSKCSTPASRSRDRTATSGRCRRTSPWLRTSSWRCSSRATTSGTT